MASASPRSDMTRGSVFGKIFMFALPLAGFFLLERIFDCVNYYVLGRYGFPLLVAAYSIGDMIARLMLLPVAGIACGALVTAAQYRGAGDEPGLDRAIHTSLALALVFGVALLPVTAILAQPLTMMSAGGMHWDIRGSYLRMSSPAIPFTAVVMVCTMLLYGLGSTLRPLFVLLISGIVRTVLICVFLESCHLGVRGIALATLISQILAAVLLLWMLSGFGGPKRIVWREIRIHPREFCLNAFIGIPVILRSVAVWGSGFTVSKRINQFGIDIAVGNSLAAQLENIIICLFITEMFRTAMVFTGQNRGAEKYDRVLKGILICAWIMTVTLMLSLAVHLVFGEQLVRGLGGAPRFTRHAMERLALMVPSLFLLGFANIVTGSLIGLGRWWAAVALLGALLGCGFRIFWINAIDDLPEYQSLSGVLTAFPVSWALETFVNGMILCLALVFMIRKRRRSTTGATP